MARTTAQIKAEILQAKTQYPELDQLNSVSQTAIWRLWVDFQAFIFNIFEQLFDKFIVEANLLILLSESGTLSWYAGKAKEFQNGSTLNNEGMYDVIDATKRIISRVSVREVTGGISVKIAKNEPPIPLTSAELQSFTTYIAKVKFAGVSANIINLPADPILVNIQILYTDISESTAKQGVKDAIKAYINKIGFDGDFVVNDMIAQCRTVSLRPNSTITRIETD